MGGQEHGDNTPARATEEDDVVLVKCTDRVMQAKTKTQRVFVPNVYGYKGDKEPTYGTAKFVESITFFLKSGDPDTLEHILARHRCWFDQLVAQYQNVDKSLPVVMYGFQETLEIFERKLWRAQSQKDVLSADLIKSLKPLNTLKEPWKKLIKLLSSHRDCSIESSIGQCDASGGVVNPNLGVSVPKKHLHPVTLTTKGRPHLP